MIGDVSSLALQIMFLLAVLRTFSASRSHYCQLECGVRLTSSLERFGMPHALMKGHLWIFGSGVRNGFVSSHPKNVRLSRCLTKSLCVVSVFVS